MAGEQDEPEGRAFDTAAMRGDLKRIRDRLEQLSKETQSAFDRLQDERDDRRRRREDAPPPPPA